MIVTLLVFLAGTALAQDATVEPTSQSTSAPETSQSKSTVYGEIGMASMYHGWDVGGDFFKGRTFRGWTTWEYAFNKKLVGYVGFWGQLAPKAHPNSAEEVDQSAGIILNANASTSVTLEVANYKVNRLAVHKIGVVGAKTFRVGRLPVTLSDALTRFTTSRLDLLRGGVVNKTVLSTGGPISKHLTLSGSAGVGVDNGPFGLGGPAALLFLQGRIDRKLNEHWSIFVDLRHSHPLAGETIRKPITSGSGGLAFRFKL